MQTVRSVAMAFSLLPTLAALAQGPSFAERADALFAIGTPSNRIGAADCGLVNGHVTFNGWLTDVAEVRGLFAPPYCATDFVLILRVNGESIPASSHLWRPEVLRRTGTNGAWRVTSRLYPVAGERAGIMEIEAENVSELPQRLLVNCLVGGGVGVLEKWQFGKPGLPPVATLRHDDYIAILDGTKDDAQVAVALPGGVRALDWRGVKPGERRRFHVSFAIGRKGEALECVRRLRAAPAAAIERSVAEWRRRVKALFDRFPALETDSPELLQVYCRSLLHLLLNEWNVPEFRLHPYYATGGMNGGCMGNYLWNHGEVYRLWPMLNPDAAKEHMRAFLRLDLSDCYAFEPLNLKPFGPYYPVNQEKILLLAHAYVLETGDRAFLGETLDGRTVIERLVAEALAHDDLSKPAVLVDYGYGNHHLELRREYRYDGVIPDMNLRRAIGFRIADELCRMAGYDPKVDLRARAEALKRLVRKELWNGSVGWFDNIEREKGGRRDRRWTMQMFKAIGWGDWALDADVEHALVRHLMDESEFLGPYGLHSLSRKDPAYDENDVDNGGPGACVSFAPAVVDRLYSSGRPAEAGRLFRRLWWLGGILPYWGDSHYADRMDYRRDTPLQNDIQGAALAQTVIFGMFGVEPRMDGSIAVTPHLPDGVGYMCLRDVKIAGREFDVIATRSRGVEVLIEGKRMKEVNGGTIAIPARSEAHKVSGDNLMPNGDFEDGEKGWRVMRPDARVEKGAGFGGTAGFVFEMQKDKEPAWPHSERFPVEGGFAYKVECRMRLEDFHLKEGANFSLSLAAYDKDGQVVRGVGATLTRITDNDVRTDGWFRAEGVSKVFPMEVRSAGFYVWTPTGCHGKVQVDDLKVTPVAANPMDLMFTSRYRDEASDGDVSFRAAYVVNPILFPKGGLRAELEYLSTNGWAKEKADMSDSLVSATVPVKYFEPGCHVVRFVLRRQDGTEMGRTQCVFTRTADRPRRKVDFDEFDRTIVDGKPFFPLGMFFGRVTEEAMHILAEGPFNCIMPYNERDEDFPLAARHGVKIIYHLSGWARDMDVALPEKAEAISRRHFEAHVRRLRDEPNLLAWYVADETPVAFRTILRERRLMVHRNDPDHPTWAVLDQVGSVRPLADGFDCLGMDPYPIGNRGDKTRTAIGIASGWALGARRAMHDTRPMWHVPQCFSWAHYRKEEAKTNPSLRWPTADELRTMTWQPIAAGANGIIYYSFFDIHDTNRSWPKAVVDAKWREVCDVAREVKAKESVLLSPPGPAVTRTPVGVVARTWRTEDGKVHLLACNTLREPVSGTVAFGDMSTEVALPPIGVFFSSDVARSPQP